jgi:steroid delta-isomerase-like uncharacterized protein
MTRDEIVALLKRRSDAWIARDIKAVSDTYADNAVVVSPFGGVQEGRAEIERVFRLWLDAFADPQYNVEETVIDGNRAVQIATLKGTHGGDFFGLAPTGRRLEFQMAMLFTVEDGVIKEERRIYDFTGVLVQVGVLKAKPSA